MSRTSLAPVYVLLPAPHLPPPPRPRPQMHAYYATYTALLRDNLPALWQHMEAEGVTPDLYLVDWLYTLFSKSLPLDVVCRIWDVFLRDGETFLARAALGELTGGGGGASLDGTAWMVCCV